MDGRSRQIGDKRGSAYIYDCVCVSSYEYWGQMRCLDACITLKITLFSYASRVANACSV